MTKDFGRIVRALFLYAPAQQNIAAYSEYQYGRKISEHIQEISGQVCTYKQVTAAEIENKLMVDLIKVQSPWDYYPTATKSVQQLASYNNLDLPMTTFKDFLTEKLPHYLQTLTDQNEEVAERGENSSAWS